LIGQDQQQSSSDRKNNAKSSIKQTPIAHLLQTANPDSGSSDCLLSQSQLNSRSFFLHLCCVIKEVLDNKTTPFTKNKKKTFLFSIRAQCSSSSYFYWKISFFPDKTPIASENFHAERERNFWTTS
jgi:hypothetical protein